ncbi:uncharacterized protein LOC121373154 [Gigantopelta aegis]|uniref:uncharacterized protein LOC121373154 n=1 Tax=Gigantopelta aegis TaxID=1735272 RepID=UPI001B8890CE|nr:uncharacterized protein LOC121373154 [Gigantopelta aegis]
MARTGRRRRRLLHNVRNVIVRKPRIFKDRSNPLEDMSAECVFQRFRFLPATIMYITGLLAVPLERRTLRNVSIPPLNQVLICLRFLACGSNQMLLGDAMNVSRASVGPIVVNVCTALGNIAGRFLHLPNNEYIRKMKQSFHQISGFPNVVGCIDGTQIRIQAPNKNEEDFVNRKGYHSLNVQPAAGARTVIMGHTTLSYFPDNPVIFPNIPVIFPDNPVIFSCIPVIFPNIPVIFPDIPVIFPDNPVIFPDNPMIFPVIFPDIPVIFPDIPVTFPDIPVILPDNPATYYPKVLDALQCPKDLDAGCKLVDVEMLKVRNMFPDPNTIDLKGCIFTVRYAMCVTNGCLRVHNETRTRMEINLDECIKLDESHFCSEGNWCSAPASEIVVTLNGQKYNSFRMLQELGLCNAIKKLYRCVHGGCFIYMELKETEYFNRAMEVCDKRHDPKVLPASDATSISASVILVLLGAMAFLFQ